MTAMIPIAEHIWDMKYRLKDAGETPVDNSVAESWNRVAKALAPHMAAVDVEFGHEHISSPETR